MQTQPRRGINNLCLSRRLCQVGALAFSLRCSRTRDPRLQKGTSSFALISLTTPSTCDIFVSNLIAHDDIGDGRIPAMPCSDSPPPRNVSVGGFVAGGTGGRDYANCREGLLRSAADTLRHRHYDSIDRRKLFTTTRESCSRSIGIRVHDAAETIITMIRNRTEVEPYQSWR